MNEASHTNTYVESRDIIICIHYTDCHHHHFMIFICNCFIPCILFKTLWIFKIFQNESTALFYKARRNSKTGQLCFCLSFYFGLQKSKFNCYIKIFDCESISFVHIIQEIINDFGLIKIWNYYVSKLVCVIEKSSLYRNYV